MAYDKWWHGLLISLSLVTWGLSQPLFDYIIANDALQAAGAKDIIVLLAVYLCLPVAFLFVADRGFSRLGAKAYVAHRIWRVALFALAGLVFLRTLQMGGHLPFSSSVDPWPLGVRLLIVGILMVALLVVAYRFYRPVNLLFIYLSVVSLVLTGLFVSQVGLLGRGWSPASASGAAEEPTAVTDLGPVFLIVFDGLSGRVLLRDGRIDPERFPHLAALGQDSAVFTNAMANYMDTNSSITTLLSGKFVLGDRSDANAPASSPLLEILADAGYLVEFHSSFFPCDQEHLVCLDRALWSAPSPRVAARNFVIWFLPPEVARSVRGLTLRIFPEELTLKLPIETIHRGDLAQWSGFLAGVISSQAKGRVYFVHSLLSHRPYEFDRYGNRVRTLSPGRLEGDFETMREAYEEQVMFLDNLVGDLVSVLKRDGLYSRSLIVVTGDHGPRSLGLRHSRSGFDYATEYPAELDGIIPWVPLIMHGPGISPQTSSVDYQHVDLLPTVLEVLRIPAPANLDGVSAFSSSRPEREKVFHAYPLKEDVQGKVTYIQDASSGRWQRNE